MSGFRLPETSSDLTWGQAKGWRCVWCDRPLTEGISMGRVPGPAHARYLNCEVWACPACDAVRQARLVAAAEAIPR